MKPLNLLAVAFAILGAQPAVVRGQDVFSLPEAQVGVAFEFLIPAEGGLPPLNWKIVAGELPPGIELQPGMLRGVPTTPRPQAYEFTVEVSDSSQSPEHFARRFSLLVKPAALHMVLSSNSV